MQARREAGRQTNRQTDRQKGRQTEISSSPLPKFPSISLLHWPKLTFPVLSYSNEGKTALKKVFVLLPLLGNVTDGKANTQHD